ncbi:hypothetical protein A9Q93_08880 [Nonlabens dokdonensis]|uniref:TonB C-terminal domain-containing protein n=2 Tax=Nonlabens dokdonensis TaxID=328515 RepID=A0A1Z8AUK8_9FLAO|nr:hypothetical protein A9Q93_08880 [Nonlabens dokdonensis]
MLDYWNETSATFINCDKSGDKINCLQEGIGNLIAYAINEQHKKNNFEIKKIVIKINIRVDENGESTILNLETENKNVQIIAQKVLDSLPLFKPPYSISKFRSVTASYAFYTSLEKNKKINLYELNKFDKKSNAEKLPYPLDIKIVHIKYPSCETSSEKEYKECFEQKISELIIQSLDKDFISANKGENASANLTFDKKGKLATLIVTSKNIELKNKLDVILEKIPKVEPATYNDEKIQSNYSIPITL